MFGSSSTTKARVHRRHEGPLLGGGRHDRVDLHRPRRWRGGIVGQGRDQHGCRCDGRTLGVSSKVHGCRTHRCGGWGWGRVRVGSGSGGPGRVVRVGSVVSRRRSGPSERSRPSLVLAVRVPSAAMSTASPATATASGPRRGASQGTLAWPIRRAMQVHGDRQAIVDGSTRFTYAEWGSQGPRPGGRTAFARPRRWRHRGPSPHSTAGVTSPVWLGIPSAGLVLNNLNYRLASGRNSSSS